MRRMGQDSSETAACEVVELTAESRFFKKGSSRWWPLSRVCLLPLSLPPQKKSTHRRLEPDKVEPFLCQRARLVEAEDTDLAADHDALGLQAVDPVALEALH